MSINYPRHREKHNENRNTNFGWIIGAANRDYGRVDRKYFSRFVNLDEKNLWPRGCENLRKRKKKGGHGNESEGERRERSDVILSDVRTKRKRGRRCDGTEQGRREPSKVISVLSRALGGLHFDPPGLCHGTLRAEHDIGHRAFSYN